MPADTNADDIGRSVGGTNPVSGDATGVPHFVQNFAPDAKAVPHFLQNSMIPPCTPPSLP